MNDTSRIRLATQDTERLTITKTGNVGIGDTSPDDLLNLLSSSEAALAITSTGTDTDAALKFELVDGTATFSMGVDDSDSDKFKISTTALGTSDRLVIDSSGNIGIGTATPDSIKLDVEDDIEIGTGTTGCVRDADNTTLIGSCVSDERLKKNITSLDSSTLEKLVQLRPITFEWRNDEFDWLNGQVGTNYGLIAQEVELHFPEMVNEDDKGYKRVSYDVGLMMRILEGVREMWAFVNDKFAEVFERLARHDDEIASLKSEVASLKAQLAGAVEVDTLLKKEPDSTLH